MRYIYVVLLYIILGNVNATHADMLPISVFDLVFSHGVNGLKTNIHLPD